MTNYSEYLTFAKELVMQGGAITRVAQQSSIEYTLKPEEIAHIVTTYDTQIEKLYIEKILDRFPDHAIYGEETGQYDGKGEFTWLIDPIDGTSNFAHGLPLYCSMIALLHNNQIVVGVVYIPALNELYYAEVGNGVFMNDTRLHVGNKTDLQTAFAFIDRGGKNYDDWYVKVITKNQSNIRGTRILGSCGVQMAFVAAGRMDAFISRGTQLYDRAPGILFVKEAGGVVVDFNGDDYSYGDQDIIVTNPALAKEIVKKLEL